MTKRRRLEALEEITGKPDLNPSLLLTDEDLLFWYGLLEQALNERSANAFKHTAPARRDEDKSDGRRDFDNMIYRIADRIKDAPPAPVPPLVLSHMTNPGSRASSVPTPAEDDLTASELLKVLRGKLRL